MDLQTDHGFLVLELLSQLKMHAAHYTQYIYIISVTIYSWQQVTPDHLQ